MSFENEPYLLANRVFYDSVSRRDDLTNRFEVARRSAPEGWTRTERDEWVMLNPPGPGLPDQGWKVHVSAQLTNADRIGRVTWDYCVERGLAFKLLRSRDILVTYNSKYAPRAASGKFMTIYPPDEAALHQLLTELDERLAGERGPNILSDLRWGTGPLFVRYGGFRTRFCIGDDGAAEYAIAGPDGELHPDRRRPVFEVPPWVSLPEFLVPHQEARDAETGEFPYLVERPLHFSNGGGVYLADRLTDGVQVVLKEARPMAGLDANGEDAVTRLRRERWALQTLAGVDGVPTIYDYFTAGEHEFLVEEFVDGERLGGWTAHEYPLFNEPYPSSEQIADYTARALALHRDLTDLVDRLHARGVVFGDLQPANILRRPDGTLVLIDFELAHESGVEAAPGLGVSGFADRNLRGQARDRYALAALGLWLFVSPSRMLALAPDKCDGYLAFVADRFPVPASFTEELRRQLGRPSTSGDAAAGARLVVRHTSDDAAQRSMAAAILLSATPDRQDRLFPGDVAQFHSNVGGFGFANGAGGVLWALAVAGQGRHPDHEDWLMAALARAESGQPGFYDGLHGHAYLADYFDRRDEAAALVDRAVAATTSLRSVDLYGGLAGAGLNLLHFAAKTGETHFADEARAVAKRLAEALDLAEGDEPSLASPGAGGLMRGWSGPALFLVKLAAETGDGGYLDLAVRALHRDLDWCVPSRNGSLWVNDVELRGLPYVEVGSAGIALVIDELLDQRFDAELAAALPQLVQACSTEAVFEPSLFMGRAGLMAAVNRAGARLEEDLRPVLARHLDRLDWHTVSYRGHIAFPGTALMRLSMDLATGTAGVLLSVHTTTAESAGFLPFFSARRGWCGIGQAGQPPVVEGPSSREEVNS